MVTAEEAKAQIQTSEEQLAQALGIARAVEIPIPTRRQLITKTRVQRMRALTEFKKTKAGRIREVEKAQREYLEKIEPTKKEIAKYEKEKLEYDKKVAESQAKYQKEVVEYEKQKKAYEQQKSEWTQAQRIVEAGKAYMAAPKSVFKLPSGVASKVRKLSGMQFDKRAPTIKSYEELTPPELKDIEAE